MESDYSPGPLTATGCFTGEFGLGEQLRMDEAPFVIGRDRVIEARHHPFDRKLLPIAEDMSTGRSAGGYYLLPTFEQAAAMCRWYQDPVDGMVVDGIPMLQRAYFLAPAAHCWQVVGAEDFLPLATAQQLVNFTRWRGDVSGLEARLAGCWPAVRDAARDQELAAAWLLCNPAQPETVGLISVASRQAASELPPTELAFLGERARAAAAAVDALQGLDRCFERSSWIYSIWLADAADCPGPKLLWPNSPPLPGL